MPESVSGVEEIINGLRGWTHFGFYVHLSDAEAAVHAAADARTQEIVAMLRDRKDFDPDERAWCNFAADLIARRFPNGGTNASS